MVDRLSAEYPDVAVRKILTGEPPWANAKVWSLDRMMREARHDLLVMSDSDIRVDRMFLQSVVADFADPVHRFGHLPLSRRRADRASGRAWRPSA